MVSCWPEGPALRPERGAERCSAGTGTAGRRGLRGKPRRPRVRTDRMSRSLRVSFASWQSRLGPVSARPRAGAPSASARPPHRGDHRTPAPSPRRSLARRTAAWRSRLPGRSRRLSGCLMVAARRQQRLTPRLTPSRLCQHEPCPGIHVASSPLSFVAGRRGGTGRVRDRGCDPAGWLARSAGLRRRLWPRRPGCAPGADRGCHLRPPVVVWVRTAAADCGRAVGAAGGMFVAGHRVAPLLGPGLADH